MTVLYNPDWQKKQDRWVLASGEKFAVVRPQITRDYSWQIFEAAGGTLISSGSSPDRIAAFNAVESTLGYRFFVEPEYVMEKGCRCGSCTEPSGRWMVFTRDDSVEEFFASESEAILWVLQHHTEAAQ